MSAHLTEFIATFKEHAPAFIRELERTRAAEPDDFERLAGRMLPWAEAALGKDWAIQLVEGYCEFVMDVNRAQLKYEKEGAYENKSFSEVYATAYSNPEFMALYHWGVYTTTFVWLHHLKIVQFFERDFLPLVSAQSSSGTLVDLGAGSGIWHLLALAHLNDWNVKAVDISESTIEQSGRMANLMEVAPRIEHIVADATRWAPQVAAQAGISCFLLEHLEEPDKLLAGLANCLEPGAHAFVTCAVTAAEIDHIFEFKSESQAIKLCEDAGFRVKRSFSSDPSTTPLDRKYLPRSMALVLQKRHNDNW
jgi:2-polyprenyl-3-methyl-5-hydroxy-6-metoxy-1,4-benzoquinol methylase